MTPATIGETSQGRKKMTRAAPAPFVRGLVSSHADRRETA